MRKEFELYSNYPLFTFASNLHLISWSRRRRKSGELGTGRGKMDLLELLALQIILKSRLIFHSQYVIIRFAT